MEDNQMRGAIMELKTREDSEGEDFSFCTRVVPLSGEGIKECLKRIARELPEKIGGIVSVQPPVIE